MALHLRSGRPNQLGARFDGEGTNFAVFSHHATQLYLSIFSEDGSCEVERIALPERTGSVWHGYAPGVMPGTPYGFRADGLYEPQHGHRFNINKLLFDPYARQMIGSWTDHASTYGFIKTKTLDDLTFDTRDSAPHVAKAIVSEPDLFDPPKRETTPDWSHTLIYEAHPKGLTRLNQRVDEALRGTYDGLATPAMLEHLTKLGVTAIELLPVHAMIDDAFLLKRGLRNYWGYNTIGFLAPEPRYFGPAGFAGFRAMVDRFHEAGIKIILDVVYNHTAEGDQRGPTLSFRGLDNASYYRLLPDQPRYYVNDTGCGNTLNVSHPFVLRLVMDSLRFWYQHMGVDGFRFDLATVLGREEHGFDQHSGFFDALRQDPILADALLIAEPWDLGPGGYQLGKFPLEFREWNDAYRDAVRRFWRGDQNSAPALAAHLLGSADAFDHSGRRASASVNFIAAHDGFTLADITRYAQRHNEANGENNADGHSDNLSDNFGVEGDTEDADIMKRRAKRQRNLLATLFLSQGTPMLLAGDEIGNSQSGNNNAYAQDNEIGWIDWENADWQLCEFVCRLSRFRQQHRALRQDRFLHGGIRLKDGQPDVEWRGLEGTEVPWDDPELSSLCLTLRWSAQAHANETEDNTVLVFFNRDATDADITLPPPPPDHHWLRTIDTAQLDVPAEAVAENDPVSIEGESVVAFVPTPRDATSS
ncbi:MAG: glycogen debranching protein GlgX [Ahrensia sp.]|nr:glycogen debranching protein GlgX [Ahrensia sp.]